MHLFPSVPATQLFRIYARPKWRAVPALAAALVFAVAFAAGQWQSGRAAEKDVSEALRAAALDAPAVSLPADVLAANLLPANVLSAKATSVDPVTLDGRRVALRGRYLNDQTLYLDNQVQNRIAGYHVLTPFQTAAGFTILVNRGWVRPGVSREKLPVIPAVTGVVNIEGRIALPPKHIYEIKPETHAPAPGIASGAANAAGSTAAPLQANTARVWQNLLIPAIAQQASLDLPPYVLRQTTDTADGLTRAWDAPTAQTGMTAAKHRGYAFQWYALAALTAFLFLFFTFIDYGKPSRNA